MDKHESDLARAEEASRILNSSVFLEAFDAIETGYRITLEAMPTTGKQGQAEDIADMLRRLKCLQDVKTALRAYIDTGKVTQRAMNLREKAESGARKLYQSLANATKAR